MTRRKHGQLSDTKFVVVFAGPYIDAELAKSALEAAGVDSVLDNEVMGRNFPWQVAAAGAGSVKVLVRAQDEVEARHVLETRAKK